MKQLCKANSNDILERIDSVSETIMTRLLPSFDAIDAEAQEISDSELKKLSAGFHPDIMDEADVFESAYQSGVMHHNVASDMRQEFLKSAAVWLFHLFEKDCGFVFGEDKPDKQTKQLNRLSVPAGQGSDWQKCSSELRLLANAIKHGPGNSCTRLKGIRPDLFGGKSSWFSDDSIALSSSDLEIYVAAMRGFWRDFFSRVL